MCEEVGEDAVVGCEWEGRRGGDGGSCGTCEESMHITRIATACTDDATCACRRRCLQVSEHQTVYAASAGCTHS